MMENTRGFFIFLLTILVVVPTQSKVSLESLVPLCAANDPKLNECVKKSANLLMPHLKEGIRDLNFPPFDPLNVPRMDIGQEGGAIYLKLELNDTVHVGLSDLHVDKVKMDLKNNIWTVHCTIPRYSITGNYKGKGRILVLPLGGAGLANFTFTDLKMDLVISGSKKMVNGQEYFNISRVKATHTFSPGKNILDIERKEGDLSLADTMRKFLREHADEVFRGMQGTLGETYSDLFTGILRNVFSKIPYNNLFKKV